MKLSKWAEKQGICYLTAYRWFKAGKILNAKQYESGTIMVFENNIDSEKDGKIEISLNNIENELIKINKKLDEK